MGCSAQVATHLDEDGSDLAKPAVPNNVIFPRGLSSEKNLEMKDGDFGSPAFDVRFSISILPKPSRLPSGGQKIVNVRKSARNGRTVKVYIYPGSKKL